MRQYAAELVGTFWLVLGGCGSAVLAAAFPEVGINRGVFGVWSYGRYDGVCDRAHLRLPPESGRIHRLVRGGPLPANKLLPYIVAQVIGAIVAGGVLFVIASGKPEIIVGRLRLKRFREHSPGGYSLLAALVTEIVKTMMFLLVILGATDKRAPQGFAPLAIGLALTLIHLISIPVTNTSVNPARSTGVAVFVGDWAIAQLWLFWVAPIVGAVIGAAIYRYLGAEEA